MQPSCRSYPLVRNLIHGGGEVNFPFSMKTAIEDRCLATRPARIKQDSGAHGERAPVKSLEITDPD